MEKYPWYEMVEGNEPISQGDFITTCPIITPPKSIKLGKVAAEVIEYDVVVMSQSCDLEYKKLDLVLVCPIWLLNEFENGKDFFKSKNGKEALRQGHVPGYHLLNECKESGFERNYSVVDFRNVYSIPFDFIVDFAKEKGKRLRLLPPYREHLSQAFARFFMRVGLPVNIPPFK